MTPAAKRLGPVTAGMLRALATWVSARPSRRGDVSQRLSTLERELAALRRTVAELEVRLPRAPVEERCRCLHCGAHLVAVCGRVTLGGQCPTCGSQEFRPIRTRAPGREDPRDRRGGCAGPVARSP